MNLSQIYSLLPRKILATQTFSWEHLDGHLLLVLDHLVQGTEVHSQKLSRIESPLAMMAINNWNNNTKAIQKVCASIQKIHTFKAS